MDIYTLKVEGNGIDVQFYSSVEGNTIDEDALSFLIATEFLLPIGVKIVPVNSADVISISSEDLGEGIARVIITSVIYTEGDHNKGIIIRQLPEAQVGDVIYIEPQGTTSNVFNESFSSGFDEIWKTEDVDPEGYGSALITDGDLDVLWSNVPYAFKRRMPFSGTFGNHSLGHDGYVKNLSLYVGAIGTISQEMATPFTDGGRESAHVPDVVYFGIHILGVTESNSLYIILAHTELPESFSSGDIISGPTKNVKMILAPDTASLLNLHEHNEFLGGGATEIYMVGPSGIDVNGEFDPIVFSETPAAAVPALIYCTSTSYGLFLISQSDLSGRDYVEDPVGFISTRIDVNSTHIFLCDPEYNAVIIKRSISDYSIVSTFTLDGATFVEDIAVDDSAIYVTDSNNDRVVKLDISTGAVIATWGVSVLDYTSTIGLNNPAGIDVDDTYVYVADTYHYRIVVLPKDLSGFGYQIGTYNGPTDYYFPGKVQSVKVNSTHIFVGDTWQYIKKLTLTGVGGVLCNVNSSSFTSGVIFLAVDDNYLYVSADNTIFKRSLVDISEVSTSVADVWDVKDIAVP